MADKNNDNTGVFFPRDKEGNDKRPDFGGSLTIKSLTFYLSIWKRKSKSGNDFMSISIQKKGADYSAKDPDPENNRGVLFVNSKKSENPENSDFQGKVKIDGKHYYIDVWEQISKKSNSVFFSLKLKEFQVKNNSEDFNQDSTTDNFNQSISFDMNQDGNEEEFNQDTSNDNKKEDQNNSSFSIFTFGQE